MLAGKCDGLEVWDVARDSVAIDAVLVGCCDWLEDVGGGADLLLLFPAN